MYSHKYFVQNIPDLEAGERYLSFAIKQQQLLLMSRLTHIHPCLYQAPYVTAVTEWWWVAAGGGAFPFVDDDEGAQSTRT